MRSRSRGSLRRTHRRQFAPRVPRFARAQDAQRALDEQGPVPEEGAPPADNPDGTTKGTPEEDPFKVTTIDEDGTPYRMC